jgi:hypothetical protein
MLKHVDGFSFAGDPNAVEFLIDECELAKSIIMLAISDVDLGSHGLFQRIGSRSKKLEELRISNFLEDDKGRDHLLIDEGHFTQLKTLSTERTNSLQRVIIHRDQVPEKLTDLYVSSCDELRELACLRQLPNLVSLTIGFCDGIVEVLPPQSGGDGNQSHQGCIYCLRTHRGLLAGERER